MRKALSVLLVVLGSVLFDAARLLCPDIVSGVFTRYFKKSVDDAGLMLVEKPTNSR